MADNSQENNSSESQEQQQSDQQQSDTTTTGAGGDSNCKSDDSTNATSKNADSNQQSDGKQQATAGIPGKDDERKLFVGGLTRGTTETELKNYFSKFGEIESVSVKMDPYTGLSRGFAFMVFQNPKAIDKLLASGDHYINKKKVLYQLNSMILQSDIS